MSWYFSNQPFLLTAETTFFGPRGWVGLPPPRPCLFNAAPLPGYKAAMKEGREGKRGGAERAEREKRSPFPSTFVPSTEKGAIVLACSTAAPEKEHRRRDVFAM